MKLRRTFAQYGAAKAVSEFAEKVIMEITEQKSKTSIVEESVDVPDLGKITIKIEFEPIDIA